VPLLSNPTAASTALVEGASSMYLTESTAGYAMKHLDPTEFTLMLEQQETMLEWLRNILNAACTWIFYD